MKLLFFIVLLIIILSLLGVSNVLLVIFHPIQTVINLVLLSVLIFIIVLYIKRKKSEDYDYDEENPHALVSGENIAGTVYASEPDNTPGLGWIL